MRLELPVLENLVALSRAAGNEVFYTVKLPDGSSRTVDVNLAWVEILKGFRALEHFLDADYAKAPNPTGMAPIG